MSLGATLAASFLVTLGRPATWPLALAAFLVRGGLLLVVAPILVLPSAVGLANVVAPMLTSFVFGGASPELVVVLTVGAVAGVLWLIGGGFVAAAAEAELTRLVVGRDEVVALFAPERAAVEADGRSAAGAPMRSGAGTPGATWRILAVRLIACAPLLIALLWGTARIVTVAYRELTIPSDVVTPVVLRVVRGAPEAVGAIVVTWLLGQVIGALAARRVALGGERVRAALAGAVGRMLRHPVRTLIIELLPLALLVVVMAPSAAAAAAAWTAVRASLATGGSVVITIVLVAAFVGLWLGGLVLAGAVSAWRAAAWTLEAAGTFGAFGPAERGIGAGGETLAR